MSSTAGLKGVIFDWAGTTIDYGCRAPAAVFVEVFRRRGIEVSQVEARGPMGMAKREHIRQIIELPTVRKQWKSRFHRDPVDADVDAIYADFIPLQLGCLLDYSDVIPGVTRTIDSLRGQGVRIGATTGYNREMMQMCGKHAGSQGYEPDVSVCADDVPAGRPAPWMALKAACDMGVYPMSAIVKVGDTYADIDEGLNAGMWTIGITLTGNEIGLSEAEVKSTPSGRIEELVSAVDRKMRERGAHYVARSVEACMPIFQEIHARIRRGDRP